MKHLQLSETTRPLSFGDLFDREAPIEIEIGVGKGKFLREYASAYPDRNFLGVEKSKKWLRHAAERLEKAAVGNVTLLEGYMEEIFPLIPDRSILNYHVYFPDPWPKRRHHHRRLFSAQFMQEVIRTLCTEGEIRVATDHMEYFDVIQRTLREFESKGLREMSWSPGPFQTNYQAKYLREGRPLAFAAAQRV